MTKQTSNSIKRELLMSKMTFAAVAALALIVVASRADAQKHIGGIRVSFDAAPTNHGSDNNGVNTGSSSGAAGGTFTPGGNNASTPNATAGAPAGGSKAAPNAAGVTVTSSGNVSGLVTTPPAQVLAGLQSGVVTITTSGGGSITVTLPPSAGAAIANAVTNPSPANGQAAGAAAAGVLTASGLPGNVVGAVSNAVAVIGGAPGSTATALGAAMTAVRASLASGSVTADQAKGLVAVLVAMRAAEASR